MRIGTSLRIILLVVFLQNNFQVEPVISSSTQPNSQPSVNLLFADEWTASFELSTSSYSLETIETDEGVLWNLQVPGFGLTNQIGYPRLPTTSVLLGIPSMAHVNISVVTEELENHLQSQ